jgi:antitoxin MazE
MQTQLVPVGNSRGIRLPKAMLAQCGIEHSVDLKVTEQGILISPVRSSRQGWEDAVRAENKHGPNADMEALSALPNLFDDAEWTWPEPKN